MYIPTIIEKTPTGERAWDIFSRLVEDRIIYLGSEINDQVANLIIAQLLFLNKKDPKKDIIMYINSPWGSVISWLAIKDTMDMISNDVVTICIGMAASMWALLLTSGTKNKRFALPNSEIMIHQPLIGWWGISGQMSDIEIAAKHGVKDTDRDNYMSAEEAASYGLIDQVIGAYDLRKDVSSIK